MTAQEIANLSVFPMNYSTPGSAFCPPEESVPNVHGDLQYLDALFPDSRNLLTRTVHLLVIVDFLEARHIISFRSLRDCFEHQPTPHPRLSV